MNGFFKTRVLETFDTASSATAAPADSADISIFCFEDEIPAFVEQEMLRLYENIFCSLVKFRMYGLADRAGLYVVRRHGEVITIFAFLREGKTVTVLNEFMKTDEQELNRFAHTIFSTYETAAVIAFPYVQTNIQRLAYPYQRVNRNEDIVAILPDTAAEYMAKLGTSTRQNIHYCRNRLKRHFSSVTFETYENESISDQHFHAILALNKARMEAKEKVQGFDAWETQVLLDLAKASGLIGVLTIDGQVCAGTIGYRVGAHFYLFVIAHDPEYDRYGLGTYCCCLSLRDCIARGVKEYHFLWGREDYKYRLSGVRRDFDSVDIYRSYTHLLLNARVVAKRALRSMVRPMMLWLLNPARRNSVLSQTAIQAVRGLRRLRRHRFGRA
jgi:CelD/BcsL family acetyltransferase involved in cellulose biosynthesis